MYRVFPNYCKAWLRMGLTEEDISNLSDYFIDTVFAWGTVGSIRSQVDEHMDAGATHLCGQPVNPNNRFGDLHWECLEALAQSYR